MSDGKKYTDAQIARQMIENVTGREVDVRSITASAATAQVHATLELAEQQRIANLIAVWSPAEASDVVVDRVWPKIAEALGLA